MADPRPATRDVGAQIEILSRPPNSLKPARGRLQLKLSLAARIAPPEPALATPGTETTLRSHRGSCVGCHQARSPADAYSASFVRYRLARQAFSSTEAAALKVCAFPYPRARCRMRCRSREARTAVNSGISKTARREFTQTTRRTPRAGRELAQPRPRIASTVRRCAVRYRTLPRRQHTARTARALRWQDRADAAEFASQTSGERGKELDARPADANSVSSARHGLARHTFS